MIISRMHQPRPSLVTVETPNTPSLMVAGRAVASAHFTHGSMEAPILVVCDPPSPETYAQHTPISLEHRIVLTRAAKEAGFVGANLVFVSLCPPIPDDDKDSAARKWAHVLPYADTLWELIEKAKPQCIVTFGDLATRTVAGRAIAITKSRGQPFRSRDYPVFPMLSPSFVARVPDHLPTFYSDWLSLWRFAEGQFTVEETKTEMSYEWCEDISDVLAMVESGEIDHVAVDTETTGVRWYDPQVRVLTVQISYREGHGLVCPVDVEFWPEWNGRGRARAKLLSQLRNLLQNSAIGKSGHNLKFDVHMLRKLDIELRGWEDDTLMLAFAVDENMMEMSQEECVRRWVPELAAAKSSISQAEKENMMAVPRDKFLLYAGSDPDGVLRLRRELKARLSQDLLQKKIYEMVQMPALRTFAYRVERQGMLVDQEHLRTFGTEVSQFIEVEYDRLIRMVPAKIRLQHIADGKKNAEMEKTLSFTRPAFVKDILFGPDGFKLTPVVWTKGTKNLKNVEEREPSTSAKDHLPFFIERTDKAGEFVQGLVGYSKAKTLNGSFIGSHNENTGIWQYLSPDSRIFPSYALHKTVTGRTACLTGDTLIRVLDPRGQVPIKDVRAGDWVVSFNDALQPVPAQVSWSGETKKVTTLVEVSFLTQGGRKKRTVRCTEDHPFRLRDGRYVRADQLQAGDRLLSVETGPTHSNYRRLYHTGKSESVLEHRMVAEAIYGEIPKKWHIHHKNEIKTDNRPENLLPLSPLDHSAHHGWTEDRIHHMLITVRNRREAGYRPAPVQMPRGQDHHSFYNIDPAWAIQVLLESGGKPSAFRDIYGMDFTTVMKKVEAHGIDWRSIKAQFEKERLAPLLPLAELAPTLKEAAQILGVNFYTARKMIGPRKRNTNYKTLDAFTVVKELFKVKGNVSVLCANRNMDYVTLKPFLESVGLDHHDMRRRFDLNGKWISAPMLRKAMRLDNLPAAMTYLNVGSKKAIRLLSPDHNHVVTGVNRVRVREIPVYDLTVPTHSNFIANGVCVHNSSNPNGQNFPARGKWAKPYQKIFKASPGFKLINADLSQIELRIAAWMAMDETMLGIYQQDGDIHTSTAKGAMLLTDAQWDALSRADKKINRSKAKAINFGYIYGMGAKKFRNFAKTDYNVDYTEKEAAQTRERFFSTYNRLPDWHKRMRAEAKHLGYVRALHGAVRHLPSIYSNDEAIRSGAERMAINSPVQRFGSDLGIMAMARFSAQADPDLFRTIGFVHDALVVEVRDGYEKEGIESLLWVMNNPLLHQWFGLTAPIPIKADAELGLNKGSMLELGELPDEDKRPAWFRELGWDTISPTKPQWWDDQIDADPSRIFATTGLR